MRRGVLIFLFAFIATVRADPAISKPTPYVGFNVADGKIFELEIPADRILRTPTWDIIDDTPPLPVGRATRLATEQFRRLVGHPEQWKRDRIILKEYGGSGHWVYIVAFRPVNPKSGSDVPFEIVVLMDGTVGEPVIREKK